MSVPLAWSAEDEAVDSGMSADDAVAVREPGAVPLAFEATYRQHYQSLARLAGLLLGDRHAGEEIAQEAFARFLNTDRPVTEPGAYLRTTVVNLSRSRVRRAVVARRHPPEPPGEVAGPEDAARRLAAHAPLMVALKRLPARQREAVVLRFYGQLGEAEMSQAMGISAGSVKTHLHRALASLAHDLEAMR